MTGSTALLSVRDLRVDFPVRSPSGTHRGAVHAVRGASFEMAEGQTLGLVGESGCGKTSLARAVLGLAPCSAGEVRFRGKDLVRPHGGKPHGAPREIQYLGQDPLAALSPRRTIWQALEEPLVHYRRVPPAGHGQRIGEALAAVDLQPEVLPCYPHELSGGQRQRVALARALLAEPALIIADEPLTSLDVSVRARILVLMRRLQRELGLGFLFISHDLAVVQQVADVVAVMYLGELVEVAPAAELFSHPAHPYTQALVAVAPGKRAGAAAAGFALQGEGPSPLTPPPGCVFHTRCPRVMGRCPVVHPGDTTLAIAGAGSGTHTVRCHLWNS